MNTIKRKPDTEACDRYSILISRNIDGDLDRSEILELYDHLASCPICQAQTVQITSLEVKLGSLRDSYQVYVPSANLKSRVMEGINKRGRLDLRHSSSGKSGFVSRVKVILTKPRTPAWGFAGAILVIGIAVLMSSRSLITDQPIADRVVVNEIPLESAEDTIKWNDDHTILPAQTVRLNVTESNSDPIFFKVISPEPGEFSVTHPQNVKDESGIDKRYRLNGVQYITLKKPKSRDVIQIRNNGKTPISLRTFSSQPRAIQTNFR